LLLLLVLYYYHNQYLIRYYSYLRQQSLHITIRYRTIFRNYKKFFMKNFNIHKIFHRKFMKKIALRKPMFQSRITIFSITTRMAFWTVVFNHINGFGNKNIEYIFTSIYLKYKLICLYFIVSYITIFRIIYHLEKKQKIKKINQIKFLIVIDINIVFK